jgi:hypothetical protein
MCACALIPTFWTPRLVWSGKRGNDIVSPPSFSLPLELAVFGNLDVFAPDRILHCLRSLARLPAVRPDRWATAVPCDQPPLRTDLGDRDDEPRVWRMGEPSKGHGHEVPASGKFKAQALAEAGISTSTAHSPGLAPTTLNSRQNGFHPARSPIEVILWRTPPYPCGDSR